MNMNMNEYVDAETDASMKPKALAAVLKVELDMGRCDDLKPREIVELANEKLDRSPVEGATVKDEAVSCREAVKALPPSFWSSETVGGSSKPQQLVDRILTTPATAGGFAIAVACEVISPSKGIDLRTVVSGGACSSVDGVNILASPGQYSTIDHEMGQFAKLFRTAGNAERLGDCTFKVTDRSQPAPGQMLMLCKSNNCSARLAALHTPKWCLLAVYHFSDVDAEAITLQILEDLREEAFSKRN
jgi:hypothetical protein